MIDNSKSVIVISPTWPTVHSGYGIASFSSLEAYMTRFKKIDYIIVSDQNKDCLDATIKEFEQNSVTFHYIKRKKNNKAWCFVASLITPYPAVVRNYINQNQLGQVIQTVNKIGLSNGAVLPSFIIEDIPLAFLIPLLKQTFPKAKFALRSHNVLSDCFSNFSYSCNPLISLAWKIENAKIKGYEKKSLELTDQKWAITTEDAHRYENLFGTHIDGVLSTYIQTNLYSPHRNRGELTKLIYFGSSDLRKTRGIRIFLDECWDKILERCPEMQFILAGKGTELFNSYKNNVIGLGFQKNNSILNKGQIFVNPQNDGSGVKLKSLIAMASGKTLVTTENGSLGINGKNGEHFIVVKSSSEMIQAIINLQNNPDQAYRIGESAQAFVERYYSRAYFLNEASNILNQFPIEDK